MSRRRRPLIGWARRVKEQAQLYAAVRTVSVAPRASIGEQLFIGFRSAASASRFRSISAATILRAIKRGYLAATWTCHGYHIALDDFDRWQARFEFWRGTARRRA